MKQTTKQIDKIISDMPGIGDIWKVYNKSETLKKIDEVVSDVPKTKERKVKEVISGEARAIIVWPSTLFSRHLYTEVQGELVRVVLVRENDKRIPSSVKDILFPKEHPNEVRIIGASNDLLTGEILVHYSDGTIKPCKMEV